MLFPTTIAGSLPKPEWLAEPNVRIVDPSLRCAGSTAPGNACASDASRGRASHEFDRSAGLRTDNMAFAAALLSSAREGRAWSCATGPGD